MATTTVTNSSAFAGTNLGEIGWFVVRLVIVGWMGTGTVLVLGTIGYAAFWLIS
jgi:hypothetical protein